MAVCAWKGCDCEGTFPAPRDPRNLGERQYFCQAHIKEFNKNWNGLTGFSEHEIVTMQHGAATWNRPTWGIGVNGATLSQQEVANKFANAHDLFEFFRQRKAREGVVQGPIPEALTLPADVKEACVIFNIETPLEAPLLKKRYLTLVKQHHPDVNKNPAAEDVIKRINVAFRILSDYVGERV